MSFYPRRHKREVAKLDFEILLRNSGFREIAVRFLKSPRSRVGPERVKSIGTVVKDLVPSLRMSFMAFAVKGW
jgi:hypothetical protein